VQKVKIALREKRVPFATEIPHELGSGRAGGEFKAANPRIEVPVLFDGSARIFESTVILEYIEERWPAPPLLPNDAADRAFARITEDVCDTHYEAVNWGFGEIFRYKRASGALADRMKTEAARQTAVLQAWLTERLGTLPWFGGEKFGWADAAAAPMVNAGVFIVPCPSRTHCMRSPPTHSSNPR
jgi:RNA polymerase-associated protein